MSLLCLFFLQFYESKYARQKVEILGSGVDNTSKMGTKSNRDSVI